MTAGLNRLELALRDGLVYIEVEESFQTATYNEHRHRVGTATKVELGRQFSSIHALETSRGNTVL